MKFDSREYNFARISFTILTLCGAWYPENWSDSKKRIYKIYTITIISLDVILIFQVFVNIVLTSGTKVFNLENIFAIMVFCVGMYKEFLVMYDRTKYIELISYCSHKEEWHAPRNSSEVTVKQEIQKEAKKVILLYGVLIIVALFTRALQPIIDAGTFIVLPLDTWCPYSVENFLVFTVTYFHQVICAVLLTCMHLAFDTLFVGLMIQVKYQLNTLAVRLKSLKGTRNFDEINRSKKSYNDDLLYIITCNVNDHDRIYRFGNDLQKTYKKMSIGQMFVVVPNIIINLYFLSVYTDRFSLKYFMTVFFLVVPLMQIFMFCWYGNEILLACSQISYALYECDWVSLDDSTRKLLLPIFMRSTRPIVMSAGAVIPYNVDSFIKIMKTSYSAFNLLQQTVHQ